MASALRLLSARPRSESQLRQRLLQKPWADPQTADRCIARLKEMGYLDDRRFAENYAAHRLHIKPVGRARLRRELAGREVEQEIIDQALDSVFEESNEEELIDRAIARRIRLRGRPADAADQKKMFAYLMRLGFDCDLIARRLREMRREE
jgi:regulatory protein